MGAVASGTNPFRFPRVVVASALLGLLPGCTAFHTQTTVTNDERVSVALQEVIDWSFEASHPATIGAPVLAKVLQGVRIGAETKVAAYSAEDIDYLAPILAGSLAKAKREQLVAFHLKKQGDGNSAAGGGTVYVKGPAIYVTPLPARGSNVSRFAAEVGFEPQGMAQGVKATTEAGLGENRLTSLIVDHWSLAKAPTSAPVTVAVPAPALSNSQAPAQDYAAKVPARAPEKNPMVALPAVAPATASAQRQPDAPAKTSAPARAPVIGSKSLAPAKAAVEAPKASTRNKAVVQPAKKSLPATGQPHEHQALLELLKKAPDQADALTDK